MTLRSCYRTRSRAIVEVRLDPRVLEVRVDPRRLAQRDYRSPDRILGATMVARHAGEMVNEITLAIVAGIGVRTLARVIHVAPVQAGGIKAAADAYCATQMTPTIEARLLRWLSR